MDATVILPAITFLLGKGFSLMTPNGVQVRTLAELEAITAELEALPDFTTIPIPEEQEAP